MKFVFFDNNPEVLDLTTYIPPEHEVAYIDIRDAINKYKPKALISPANSFATMGGGIDGLITRSIFPNIAERVQAKIKTINIVNEHDEPYFPVGSAVPIRTGNPKCLFMITTPTMEYPQDIQGTNNVYLAFSALLQLAAFHKDKPWIFLVPGMGTGVGGLTFKDMGQQVQRAFQDFPTFHETHTFLKRTQTLVIIDNGVAKIKDSGQTSQTTETSNVQDNVVPAAAGE